jgi:glycosyltransferase involved in cell wall biosynthesis
MIGNFIPIKGHEFLIKGISEACKRNAGVSLKVLCAGRIIDADYYKRILRLAKDQGIENRVIFCDYTTDVAGKLSAADIFILPSKREGFSRSLLEAMVMELPVIATNISEIAEAVEDHCGGILVKDGDVDAMANAILQLCRDPDLRESMGKENKNRVMKYFTADIHRKAIENIYSTLLAHETN